MFLLDPVSTTAIQAGQMLTGAATVGFLGASLFHQRARQIRLTTAICYFMGVIACVAYHLR
jgi:hypothetical protein